MLKIVDDNYLNDFTEKVDAISVPPCYDNVRYLRFVYNT